MMFNRNQTRSITLCMTYLQECFIVSYVVHCDHFIRVYFGWGLTGLFTVIVILVLLGICCGCLGHDSEVLPTERGFMSNCGGRILVM